jgi:cadmium resistance transport/sequestration family protein
MSELVTAITTGLTAFSATNIDDLVILILFFSQVNGTFRRRHIVIGQYLGFTALVLASLPGFFGGLIVPQYWIGRLGLIPITIGLNLLFNPERDASEEVKEEIEQFDSSNLTSFLSPQIYNVAAITLANGGDNVSIYVPLFASSNFESFLVILGVFFLLLGVWCYVTYKLSRQPAIADVLTRYGNTLVPFVLIGLGVFIVLKSQSLHPLALVASCLCLIGLVRMNERSPEVEKN